MTVESERRRIEGCQVINHDMTMDDDIGIHLLGDGGQGTPFTLLWLCCEEEMKIAELQLKKIWDQQKNCGKLLVIEMQYPFLSVNTKIKDTE